MRNWKMVNVNLASQPLRNRRFFFAAAGLLTVTFILVMALAGSQFLKYRRLEREAGQGLSRIVRLSETAQREKAGWTSKVQDLSGRLKEKIGLLNSLILEKSFSWVEFFSLLEQALPASSYITTMTPEQTPAGNLDVRFKVVSQNFSDLLQLVKNLYALKFKRVLLNNETQLEGQMLYELSASYERLD